MRSNRLFWAVLLVAAGLLFLASNLGFLSLNIWGLIWPMVLILLGIWFLVGTTLKQGDPVLEQGSIELGDAARASVVIKHGAGRLAVSGDAESGKLVSGSFANGLEAKVKKVGDALQVVMQPRMLPFPDVIFPWTWASTRGFEWDFGFAKDLPLDLVFEIGAVDAQLDLTQLQVKDLVLKTGASSTDLTMPAAAGLTNLKIEAGAALVKIHVPQGVAARIESTSGLLALTVDQKRFPKQDGIYVSPEYDTAENKLAIRIEAGVGTVEIH